MKFIFPDGATPIADLSDLKLQWIRTQDDLNMAEAENISSATIKHLGKRISSPHEWLSIPFLKKLHFEMFCNVWGWAGEFRRTQTIPGIVPYQIPRALEALCSDVAFWGKEPVELTILEQAAILHHRLVCIHPFENGNGRFSRLVADRYMRAFRCKSPAWPTDLGSMGTERTRYIGALRDADRGNLEALINFMSRHGARDSDMNDVCELNFFHQRFSGQRLASLKRAYVRRGYLDVSDLVHL